MMSPELKEALKNLRKILQNECNPQTVSVTVFISSQGYDLSYKTRSPGSLYRDSVSMRNICGNFINEN